MLSSPRDEQMLSGLMWIDVMESLSDSGIRIKIVLAFFEVETSSAGQAGRMREVTQQKAITHTQTKKMLF